MPDLEYSHTVHRQNLQTIWRSGYWHESKTIFLGYHTDNKCERCLRVGVIVPGHKSQDYLDMATYVLKVRENKVKALCPTCNWQESKGRKPCPSCIEVFHAGNRDTIHYIGQEQECCYGCLPEEEKAARERNKKEFSAFLLERRDEDNRKRRKFYREKVKKK